MAKGANSHAEGQGTIALGTNSYAAGAFTISSGSNQTVLGQYNKQNNTTSLFVIGNGNGATRSDILNITTTSVQITGSTQITSDVALCITDGSTSIGAASSDNSAKLQIASTTKGFLPPVMNTTQRTSISSPANGLIVYDTTLGQLCIYIVDAWKGISMTTI